LFSQCSADIPPEVLRQREAKWLDMLNSWDKWMAKKTQEGWTNRPVYPQVLIFFLNKFLSECFNVHKSKRSTT